MVEIVNYPGSQHLARGKGAQAGLHAFEGQLLRG
jgi:hypothetical protein